VFKGIHPMEKKKKEHW